MLHILKECTSHVELGGVFPEPRFFQTDYYVTERRSCFIEHFNMKLGRAVATVLKIGPSIGMYVM